MTACAGAVRLLAAVALVTTGSACRRKMEPPAPAPPPVCGTIGGTVRAMHDGEPLAGVTVHLMEPPGNRLIEAMTDADGSYRLPVLPPGLYRLEIRLPTFRTEHVTLTVRAGEFYQLDAELVLARATGRGPGGRTRSSVRLFGTARCAG